LIYFLDLSICLLSNRGVSVFITQNSWLDTDYGKKFQSFLLKHTHVKAIVDSDFKYFDSNLGPNINTVISFFIGNKTPSMNDDILFARYHENFVNISSSIISEQICKLSTVETKRFRFDDQILSTLKWGVLLSSTDTTLDIISLIEKKGKRLCALPGYDIDIGQGLNISKTFIVKSDVFGKFPFLKNKVIPFITSEDAAQFVITETIGFIIDRSKLDDKQIRKINDAGISIFDPNSTSKLSPILILPRGVSRHFCALNLISAYSASTVDIYDKSKKLPEDMKLNIWVFLNSSIAWLLREITGRKSLGGGLLKAEASDLKEMPIYFDFNQPTKISKIYDNLRKRPVLPTIEEIKTQEHKEIDKVVFKYLNLSDVQQDEVVALLIKHISARTKKART